MSFVKRQHSPIIMPKPTSPIKAMAIKKAVIDTVLEALREALGSFKLEPQRLQ